MLSIKFIRENADLVKEKIANKNVNINLDEFLSLDQKRIALQQEADVLKQERNSVSKEIGKIKAQGGDISEITAKTKDLSDRIKDLDTEIRDVEEKFNAIYFAIPNMYHDSVPLGKSEDDNVVYREANGELKEKSKDHIQICEELGIIDFTRGAKISGSGFPVYRGFGARLERAVISFMLELHADKHGYEEMLPPFLVTSQTAFGTGQLPKSKDQMYYMNEDDLYAVPTAEVPVTNLYRDETVDISEKPMSFVAYTPCFRREAGSWGKDTRGLLRLHQFNKVELVKYVKPEESYAELEKLRDNAEEVLRLLKLPYRILLLCSADLSFAASKCYDLELWAPGTKKFLEVSSCSNFEDFQSRRMNIRFRNEDNKLELVHTLNGSGVATARLMVAIIETYYNEETGVLEIPEVLRPYLGGRESYSGK